MTDKERLIATFDAIGLKYRVDRSEPPWPVSELRRDWEYDSTAVVAEEVSIGEGTGYIGFYFDDVGEFVAHGCWE